MTEDWKIEEFMVYNVNVKIKNNLCRDGLYAWNSGFNTKTMVVNNHLYLYLDQCQNCKAAIRNKEITENIISKNVRLAKQDIGAT